MSWLYSQALVAEYLEATCSDGEQSALSSGNPTQQAYLLPDRMTAFSLLSRYGMTFAPLTDDRGEDLLMWYREDFLAKTYQLQEPEQVSTESAAECGRTWPASLAKYDPGSHSLRTAQLSLLEDSTEFSATLPRSGTMRNGECYQQPMLERITSARESGLLPTPTVCGNYNRKGASATSGDGLETYVKKFPTPTATAHKGWSKNHNRANTDDRIDYTIEREASESGMTGRLNPEWVEWLMGWPLGHTDLKPLGMDKFHEWQRQHSPNCADAPDGD